VRVAARFIRDHAEAFPGGAVPGDAAQLAVLAVRVSDVFLPEGPAAAGAAAEDVAAAVVRSAR
jgi:hypothetical protein